MSMGWNMFAGTPGIYQYYTNENWNLLSPVSLNCPSTLCEQWSLISPSPVHEEMVAISRRAYVGDHNFSEFMRAMTKSQPEDTVPQQPSLMSGSHILSVCSLQ